MKFCSTLILIIAITYSSPTPGSSAFTYQGELNESGQPANGLYDMEFELWDSVNGGSQMGTTLVVPDVTVNGGIFTVELDFGVAPLGPAQGSRWLEISIQGVVLVPRQPLSAAPFAVQTRGIFVDENFNASIGDSTTPASLTVAGAVISNTASGGQFQTRNPNNQNASFLLGWQDDVARIRYGGSGAGAGGGINFQRSGDQSLLYLGHGGNIGIGTTTPAHPLHILDSSPRIAIHDSDDTGDAQVGFISYRDSDDVEQGWVGFGSSGDTDLSITNNIGDVRLLPLGRVGIGEGDPDAFVHINRGDSGAPFVQSTFKVEDSSGATVVIASGTNSRLLMQSDQSANYGYLVHSANEGFFGLGAESGGSLFFDATELKASFHRVDTPHPLTVGTSTSDGNGAHVTTGGMWTNGSDRNSKQDFRPVDVRDILARLVEMPVTQWRYKGEDDSTRHIGPVAQDFMAAFGLGQSDTHIGTVDADGVAYAAIKGLNQLVVEKEAEINALNAENQAIRERLDRLEALVRALASRS